MDKRFWGILIGVVIILGGIFWLTSSHNKNNNSGNGQPTNHVQGQNKYGVNLVEYGDYECPYCGEYYSTIKQVVQTYSPYISFQFRNLPLTQIHPNAFAGARAAEAAGLMGQFWPMHDLLYESNVEYYASNQKIPSWINSSNPLSYFDEYARQLGLNTNKFNQNYQSTQVNNLINADIAQFPKDYTAATGSYDPTKDEATPTFFLDGKHIQPANSVASFEQLLNAAIKKKGGTPPAGTSTGSSSATTGTTGQSVQPSKKQ